MLRALRNSFIAGLIILLPLGLTVLIINFLIAKVGGPTSSIIFWFLDPGVRSQIWMSALLDIAATIVVFLIITFLGLISRYFFGRLIFLITEKIVSTLPFVSNLYKTIKQIVDTFSKQHKAVFQKCVLIEYPKKGVYALGFLTSQSKGEIQEKTQAEVCNIFVPTTPNPTSGFLLMVPIDQVIELDMSIADGMKLVISGGAVVPSNYQIKEQPKNPNA